MKKYKALLIFFTVLFNINLYSQANKEEIIKARDYTTYKLIEKFINNLKITNNADIKNEYSIIIDSFKINSFEESITLTKLETLSNKFASLKKLKIFEKVKNLSLDNLDNHTNKEISNDLVTNIQKAYNDLNLPNRIDLSAFKLDIENNLDQISKKRIEKDNLKNTEANNEVDSNKESVSVNPNSTSFFSVDGFNIWNFISILLGLTSIILVIFLPKKVIVQTSKHQNNNESTQSTSQVNSMNPIEFEKMIRKSSLIEDIAKNVYLLKNANNLINLGETYSTSKQDISSFNQDSNVNNNIFYIYKPIENYFSRTNVQTSKKDTLYKFIINTHNKNEATFEIITDGALPTSEITKRIETLIKPACEEENAPTDIVRNIFTKRKGIVILEGDKWVIKSKALIRYE